MRGPEPPNKRKIQSQSILNKDEFFEHSDNGNDGKVSLTDRISADAKFC